MAGKEIEGPGLSWKAPHLDGHGKLAGEAEKESYVLLVNAFRGWEAAGVFMLRRSTFPHNRLL